MSQSQTRWGVLAVLVVSLTASPRPVAAQAVAEPIRTRGQIDAVTVYRGQAMVSRVVEMPAGEGPREVVVEGLPAHVVPNSVYAEASGEAGGLEIRSVRFRTHAVLEDVREEVRQLDEQIKQTQRNLAAVQRHQQVLENQMALLGKLEAFTAPATQWEIARGVLNAETLQSLTDYLFDQRERIAEEQLQLTFQAEDIEQGLSQLRRQRSELASSASRTAREAVVFLDGGGDAGTFRLHYLVNQASWTPSYNVRAGGEAAGGAQADGKGDEIVLEYLASVQQVSGEDWNNVRMTLSTATPSLVAEAPKLATMTVTLTQPRPASQAESRDALAYNYASRKAQLEQQQEQLARQREQNVAPQRSEEVNVANGSLGDDARRGGRVARSNEMDVDELDVQLNRLTVDRDILQIQAGRAERDKPGERRLDQETVSVTYKLPARTSLPSRSDQQLLQIAEQPMQAEFYHIAVPVLTRHVYREAKGVNAFDSVLLAGPVSSYLDGEFVGRGAMPTVAVGEPFTVGFGIDSALQAERELIDRTETTQGGNRLVTLAIRLSLSNFSDVAKRVRLLDRLPVPDKGADIQVNLVETSQPLAVPADDTLPKDGRLRWDVDVPAGTSDEQAVTVDYTYRLEFDRQKVIEGSAE